MTITIESVDFKASERLQEYVQGKVRKLSNSNSQIAKASVRLFKDDNGNYGNQVCEIYLTISGDKIFAKKGSGTYEQAVIDVVESLQKTLKRMRI